MSIFSPQSSLSVDGCLPRSHPISATSPSHLGSRSPVFVFIVSMALICIVMIKERVVGKTATFIFFKITLMVLHLFMRLPGVSGPETCQRRETCQHEESQNNPIRQGFCVECIKPWRENFRKNHFIANRIRFAPCISSSPIASPFPSCRLHVSGMSVSIFPCSVGSSSN